jgi:hypothetical protein
MWQPSSEDPKIFLPSNLLLAIFDSSISILPLKRCGKAGGKEIHEEKAQISPTTQSGKADNLTSGKKSKKQKQKATSVIALT